MINLLHNTWQWWQRQAFLNLPDEKLACEMRSAEGVTTLFAFLLFHPLRAYPIISERQKIKQEKACCLILSSDSVRF